MQSKSYYARRQPRTPGGRFTSTNDYLPPVVVPDSYTPTFAAGARVRLGTRIGTVKSSRYGLRGAEVVIQFDHEYQPCVLPEQLVVADE